MSKGSFLKPFSKIKECTKCGGLIKTEYYDGEARNERVRLFGDGLLGTGLNYLIKTCLGCGYSWRERTKDEKND